MPEPMLRLYDACGLPTRKGLVALAKVLGGVAVHDHEPTVLLHQFRSVGRMRFDPDALYRWKLVPGAFGLSDIDALWYWRMAAGSLFLEFPAMLAGANRAVGLRWAAEFDCLRAQESEGPPEAHVEEERWMPLSQAGRLLGIHRNTLRSQAWRELIPAARVDYKDAVYWISKDWVEVCLQQKGAPA